MAKKTFCTDTYIRNYIDENYHPDYPILSIGGSHAGKFFRVYIEIAPGYSHLVLVPTRPTAKRMTA
jgi:hypothetical protein